MRDFSYNGIRALITLVLAIIFATLFKGRGKATEQYTDVLNISGAMYAASVFSSVLYLFMVRLWAHVWRRAALDWGGGRG